MSTTDINPPVHDSPAALERIKTGARIGQQALRNDHARHKQAEETPVNSS